MLIPHLEHDGRGYSMMTAAELLSASVPRAAIVGALAAVAIAAGENEARLRAEKIFTRDPVQAQIYAEKFAEAKAYDAADPKPSPATTPLITAEAAARDIDRGELAALVVAKGEAWRAKAAAIEAARVGVKLRVAVARQAFDGDLDSEMSEIAAALNAAAAGAIVDLDAVLQA